LRGVAYVGWNGTLAGQGSGGPADYLTAGGGGGSSRNSGGGSAAGGDALELSAALADALGLPGATRFASRFGPSDHPATAAHGRSGRVFTVRCTALGPGAVRRARRVEVAPASAGDWEVGGVVRTDGATRGTIHLVASNLTAGVLLVCGGARGRPRIPNRNR
jgi:hypothetical protein